VKGTQSTFCRLKMHTKL